MNILSFDTSSPWFLGAVQANQRQAILCTELGMQHQEQLIPLLEQLCRLVDIDISAIQGIVCGKGPGSFTGIRVAMAAAKGIATALEQPMASISLLDAMAHAALSYYPSEHSPMVVPVLDAKKQRWYSGFYDRGQRQGAYLDLSLPELAASIAQHSLSSNGVLISGPDAKLFVEEAKRLEPAVQWLASKPSQGEWAQALLELGQQRIIAGNWDGVDEGPEYVRISDAEMGISAKAATNLSGTNPVTEAT